MQKKKVGIFGGSFNPIHTGHIALAKSLCQQAGLDEVWLMVSPMNPFKKEATDLLTDKLRLEMAEQAIADEPKLKACDYEFHMPKPSYTAHAAGAEPRLPPRQLHPPHRRRQLGFLRQMVSPRRHPEPLPHRRLSAKRVRHRKSAIGRNHSGNASAQHQQHRDPSTHQGRQKHTRHGTRLHRATGHAILLQPTPLTRATTNELENKDQEFSEVSLRPHPRQRQLLHLYVSARHYLCRSDNSTLGSRVRQPWRWNCLSTSTWFAPC